MTINVLLKSGQQITFRGVRYLTNAKTNTLYMEVHIKCTDGTEFRSNEVVELR